MWFLVEYVAGVNYLSIIRRTSRLEFDVWGTDSMAGFYIDKANLLRDLVSNDPDSQELKRYPNIFCSYDKRIQKISCDFMQQR